jgi:hypothetical protein
MSLEMAHKVIVPPKKNYIPQFLKQRDINSYKISGPTQSDRHLAQVSSPNLNIDMGQSHWTILFLQKSDELRTKSEFYFVTRG